MHFRASGGTNTTSSAFIRGGNSFDFDPDRKMRGRGRQEQMGGIDLARGCRRVLIGFLRMGGATAITAEVSIGKVRTSAMTEQPGKFFEEARESLAFANFPAGILIQGGVPLTHDNECAGAVGVSGVQSHEDEQVAEAGAGTLV